MAFDVYMQAAGIPGESTDDKHKDWIKVMAFSHGVSQAQREGRDQGGVRVGGRCDHADFTITKLLDKASPKFNLQCCSGTLIPKVTIELCQQGGDKQLYMKYEMEDVLVTSVNPGGGGHGADSSPLETLGLGYGKITWTYTQLDEKTNQPKGNTVTFWDCKTNVGG